MAQLSPAQMALLGGVNGYAAGYSGGGTSSAGQAAAGMAAMNAMGPYGAAFGAAAQLGSAALADNTPMTNNTSFQIGYDNSGWAVTVGDGSSASTEQIKTPSPTAAAAVKGILGNPIMLLAILAAVGLVIYAAD